MLTFIHFVHSFISMKKTKGQIIRKLLLYVITFAILGGITYGIITWNRNKKPETFERQEPIVSVVKPVKRSLNEVITVSGYVESNLMAPIVSFVNGRVIKLNVDAGDRVQKDDIIARISPENYADIKAPENGVVLTTAVKEGDMVQTGTLVAVIGNPDDKCANINVPEKYSTQIQMGQKAVITHKDTGAKYEGKIVQIDPYINPKNKTFKVKINIDPNVNNASETLMIGSSVSVDVVLKEYADVYAVPIACLNSSDLLYTVHNSVVESVDTDDLVMDEQYVMVKTDTPDVDYIIRGQNRVFPGQKVRTELYKDSV